MSGGHHIMQQHHVYSVAGTTSSVRMTLQIKWETGGRGGVALGLVAMGMCILRANSRWFDWGPWQWTALTLDPVQPVSLYHSPTHSSELRTCWSKNSLLCVINNASTLE